MKEMEAWLMRLGFKTAEEAGMFCQFSQGFPFENLLRYTSEGSLKTWFCDLSFFHSG